MADQAKSNAKNDTDLMRELDAQPLEGLQKALAKGNKSKSNNGRGEAC